MTFRNFTINLKMRQTQNIDANKPDTTTVENLEPNFPLEDNLQGDGC